MSANLVQLAGRARRARLADRRRAAERGGARARRADRRRHPRRRRGDRPARGDRARRRDVLRRPARPARAPARARLHRDGVLRGDRAARTSTSSPAGLGRRARASAPPTARVSLAETVCLGFCHSAPAVRDGDVVDAGPGRRRARPGGRRAAGAASRAARSLLAEPALTVPGRLVGAARACWRDLDPDAARSRRSTAADLRGRGGAWFPAAQQVGVRPRGAQASERYIVANGDEGDPGSYIDKHLMERSPALVLEGMALAGLRGRRDARASCSCARSTRGRARRSRRRSPRRAPRGCSATDILGLRLLLRRARRRRRGLVRRGGGDRAARLPARPARHGLRAPAVPRRARALRAPDRRPQHRDARERPGRSPRAAPRPTATSARRARTRGTQARLLQRALRAPRRRRGPVRRCTVRELCEDVAGGLVDGRAIKAVQIGGPLGGILPGVAARHAVRHRAARRSTAAWSGTARSSPSTTTTDMRARRARTCSRSARTRAAARASRAGSACSARTRSSPRPQAVDRARLEALLETLEVASLCAHGGGMPAPIRSLLDALPGRAGAALMRVTIDGTRGRGRARDDRARGRARGGRAPSRRSASTSGWRRSAPAASASSASHGPGRARPTVVASCTTPCREGMVVDTRDPRRAASSAPSSSSSCPSCPRAPAPHTELAAVARDLGVRRAALERRGPPERDTTRAIPYLAFQHELCISCGRCVRACDEIQGAFALTAVGRGFDANVAAGIDAGLPRLRLRLVRRLRGHLPDRRDHRAVAAGDRRRDGG